MTGNILVALACILFGIAGLGLWWFGMFSDSYIGRRIRRLPKYPDDYDIDPAILSYRWTPFFEAGDIEKVYFPGGMLFLSGGCFLLARESGYFAPNAPIVVFLACTTAFFIVLLLALRFVKKLPRWITAEYQAVRRARKRWIENNERRSPFSSSRHYELNGAFVENNDDESKPSS